MTAAHFDHLLSAASVRLVSGKSPGLFVEGLTQEELAGIVTIAGRALGAIREDVRLNPHPCQFALSAVSSFIPL